MNSGICDNNITSWLNIEYQSARQITPQPLIGKTTCIGQNCSGSNNIPHNQLTHELHHRSHITACKVPI